MIENRSNKNDSQKTLAIILVSTDGHAHFLPACFQSIAEAATHVSVHVILVDNDGHGKSSVIVRDYMDVLDLKMIHQKIPKGFAGNVNDALKKVREPYVLLLNTDTILSKESLSTSLRRMQENTQIGALSVRMKGADGQLQASGRIYPTPLALFWEQVGLSRMYPDSRIFGRTRLWYVHKTEITDVDWISGAFFLLRTKAMQEIGEMDERFFMYSEDTDYCYRLYQNGWRVVIDPEIEIYHHKDPLGKTRRKETFIQTHKSLLLLWKKHNSWYFRTAGKVVLFIGLFMRFMTLPLLLKKGPGFLKDSFIAYCHVAILLLKE